MARRTTVGIERRTQANSRFAGYGSGHRVYFLEAIPGGSEERLFSGVERRKKTTRSRGASARARICLREKRTRAEEKCQGVGYNICESLDRDILTIQHGHLHVPFR